MYTHNNSESVYQDSVRVRTYNQANKIFADKPKNKLYHYHSGNLAGDRELRKARGNYDLDKIGKLFYKMAETENCQIFQKTIDGICHYFCRY
tara:strand:+ start:589 stop:864 length:276 start_codon:yes stop_codon:yes gene_type:complete